MDDRPPTPLPISPLALAWEFARRVSAPLKTRILKAPPRRRTRRSPSLVSIRRSMRLAAKCASRAPNTTLQAQKVLCVQVGAFCLTAIRYPGSGGFQEGTPGPT
jgi:hypothetical protein